MLNRMDAPDLHHPEALRALLEYPWPGNVRELENVIERVVILCTGQEVEYKDLPPEIRQPAPHPVTSGHLGAGDTETEDDAPVKIPASVMPEPDMERDCRTRA